MRTKIVLEIINFEARVLTSYIISRCGRKIRCYRDCVSNVFHVEEMRSI